MYLLFSGSLLYCYYSFYFGFSLLPAPYEYAIIGVGIISFARIINRIGIKEIIHNIRNKKVSPN
jgi:hypothetical protein